MSNQKRKPFVSREEGGKLRQARKPYVVSGVESIRVAPMPEVITLEVSRQDLVNIIKTMEWKHRRDGYIAQVNGELVFFEVDPQIDAAPITRDQIYNALEKWPQIPN